VKPLALEVSAFAEIEAEFIARVHSVIWCNMATVDRAGRPRSRIVHPVWEGPVAWSTSRRNSHKSRHLEQTPYVSLAYVADVAKPVYVDCRADWVDDLAEKTRVWEFIKSMPEPVGFDPGMMFSDGIEDANSGFLKFTPWRVQLVTGPRESLVWRQDT
jgi:general stress protein 26